MKLEITEYISNAISASEKTTTIIVADFDTGVGAVPLSTIQAKGDILVGTAAGQIGRFGAGSDGQSIVYDSSSPTGLGYGSPGQAANATLTNKSGGAVQAGDVLVFSSSYDTAFESTTVANDLRVCGVAGEYIENGDDGAVNTVPGILCQVNCDTGAVIRGEWLVSSATEFKAKGAGFIKPVGAFALALTAKPPGPTGSVQAILVQGFLRGVKGNSGWAVGGSNGAALVTNVQKFTVASGTWAVIAGAALSIATYAMSGIGNTTVAGYSEGGFQAANIATAYKMPYATEVFAAAATADLSAARRSLNAGGMNGQSRGYGCGGYVATQVATNDKVTFATDTAAAINNLTVARQDAVGISDGTYGYVVAGYPGSALCDMITFATDAVADHNDGDVTAGQGYVGMNFQATAGYMAMKSGATDLSKKITFATGVSAVVTSHLPVDQAFGFGVSDGLSLGWICGDDASPYTAAASFNQSTETYAADGDAVLASGKFNGCYFSNGSY